MNFNFEGAAKAKEGGKFLSAGIKNATFQGIGYDTKATKNGDSAVMILKLNIDEYGDYQQLFFEPQSAERSEGMYGTNASQLDHFLISVREIIEALNPELLNEMTKFTGTFRNIVKKIKDLTDPFIGAPVQVKFIPQNNGFNSLPTFTARINKDGSLGIATYFIKSADLTLTPSEKKKIEAAANATPTDMTKKSTADTLGAMAANLGVDTNDAGEDDDLPF